MFARSGGVLSLLIQKVYIRYRLLSNIYATLKNLYFICSAPATSLFPVVVQYSHNRRLPVPNEETAAATHKNIAKARN